MAPRVRAKMRLFIAAYPPAAFARALLDRLGDPPDGWRPTPPGQHHLTIHFVGAVERPEAARVEQTLRHACAGLGAFGLEPRGLLSLPSARRPRVLALGLWAPAELLELRRRLVRRLARSPREKDRFTPHMTLARAEKDAPSPPTPAMPGPIDPGGLPPWRVDEVRLVRSTLSPGGAIHQPIATVPLAAAPSCGAAG